MLSELKRLLESNQIRFRHLAFAYCKKQPKQLNFLKVLAWDAVTDQVLLQILRGQLLRLVAGRSDENAFVGRYTGAPVDLGRYLPADLPPERTRTPLVRLLGELLADPRPETCAEVMRLAALKYLVQDTSRSALLCLITLTAALGGRDRELCFLTQVELEEERIDAFFDEQLRQLRSSVLRNVFREKYLTKLALYPWWPAADAPEYDPEAIYVHNEQAIAYWNRTLECRRERLTARAEQEAVLTIVGGLTNGELGPAAFASLARKAEQAGRVGPAEVAAALNSAGYAYTVEAVTPLWETRLPAPGYQIDGPRALGPQATHYTITSGDLVIKARPGLLERMRQFSFAGRHYLLIQVPERVRVSAGTGTVALSEQSWQEVRDKVENPQ